MGERFFVESPISADKVTLDGPEAHHLIHVMRAQVGSEVVLFDGGGSEFQARVTRLHRATADLAVLQRCNVDRELPGPVTLGVALPKGDRQRWLVEKCVELGVRSLFPLDTRRGVAQPTEQALARLRRVVIEASKQCGRNRLMEIGAPCPITQYFASRPPTAVGLIAEQADDPNQRDLRRLPIPKVASHILLAVGPEGGFTGDELDSALAAGWRPIDLGARVLRVETAALALVAGIILQP